MFVTELKIFSVVVICLFGVAWTEEAVKNVTEIENVTEVENANEGAFIANLMECPGCAQQYRTAPVMFKKYICIKLRTILSY